jgi:hypothetical protein
MTIRPVGAELFHENGRTNRQTDMAKVKIAFVSSANHPKNRAMNLKHPSLVSTF